MFSPNAGFRDKAGGATPKVSATSPLRNDFAELINETMPFMTNL